MTSGVGKSPIRILKSIFSGISRKLLFFFSSYILQESNKKFKVITDLLNGKSKAIDSKTNQLDHHLQAQFVPYDQKWEFPKNRLRLGNDNNKK